MALKALVRLCGVSAHRLAQLRRKHWVCTCCALCMLCLGSMPVKHTLLHYVCRLVYQGILLAVQKSFCVLPITVQATFGGLRSHLA
jgi:hypothetical protein